MIRPCEPDLITTPAGWLATTPKDHPYRIGVVGDTKNEARRRFAAEFAAWEELIDLVHAERAGYDRANDADT